MNYRKHYNKLIKRAKSRILEGYVEKHHIVPKCLGGHDDLSNLVALTPEEHFLAHLLLVKMYPNEPKLVYAARMMTISNGIHKRSNKYYGWLKRKYSLKRKGEIRGPYKKESKPRKLRAKETKPRAKRVLSEEHRRKIGLGLIGRPVSDEQRRKASLANKQTKAMQKLQLSL